MLFAIPVVWAFRAWQRMRGLPLPSDKNAARTGIG